MCICKTTENPTEIIGMVFIEKVIHKWFYFVVLPDLRLYYLLYLRLALCHKGAFYHSRRIFMQIKKKWV